MKQGPFLLALVGFACLATGYFLGEMKGRNSPGSTPAGASHNPRADTRSVSRERSGRTDTTATGELLSSVLSGRSLRDLSDAELAGIVLDLSDDDSVQDPYDRARRAFQLQILLSKLSIPQLQAVAFTATSVGESRNAGLPSQTLRSIAEAMAAKDPSQALAWARDQERHSSLVGSILTFIAGNDPSQAAGLYQKALMDGSLDPVNGWEGSVGVARPLAKLGMKPWLEFVDSLPRQQQDNVLANTLREIPESDRLALAEEIYRRFKAGSVNGLAFEAAISAIGSGNPAALDAWLEKIPPGPERTDQLLKLATGYSATGETRKEEYMARAIASMPGEEKAILARLGNSRDIVNYMRQLPPSVEIKAADLAVFVSGFGSTKSMNLDPVLDMAAAMRDPAERVELITGVLEDYRSRVEAGGGKSPMNAKDFEILGSRLKALDLSADAAGRVNAAFEAARPR